MLMVDREFQKTLKFVIVVTGEFNTVMHRAFKISEYIFGMCEVSFCWLGAVFGKDICDGCNIRTGRCGEPS